MSFTTDVISELMEAPQGKTCCRKAMLFGLFFGALVQENNTIRCEFRNEEIANKASEILKKQFSSAPEVFEVRRAGRCFYALNAQTKAISSFLQNADKDCNRQIHFSNSKNNHFQ